MGWRPRRSLAFLTLALGAAFVRAEVYQEPDAFVAEVFGRKPAPEVLWLTKPIQAEASAILGHPPAQLRQRYWSDGRKSVWILEETGKEPYFIDQCHFSPAGARELARRLAEVLVTR